MTDRQERTAAQVVQHYLDTFFRKDVDKTLDYLPTTWFGKCRALPTFPRSASAMGGMRCGPGWRSFPIISSLSIFMSSESSKMAIRSSSRAISAIAFAAQARPSRATLRRSAPCAMGRSAAITLSRIPTGSGKHFSPTDADDPGTPPSWPALSRRGRAWRGRDWCASPDRPENPRPLSRAPRPQDRHG